MIEFISNNLSFVGFILVMSIFLVWKRKNLSLQGSFPIFYVLMYRTSLGLEKMDKWSKKHPNVFLYLGYLSAFVGVVGAVFIFLFMFWQLNFIVENQITSGGGLVLPVKTESGLSGPLPVFYVPFWYWIIALFILALVHEFAHGVISERFGIKIKSSGFAFFGILFPFLPAAFVEPDEKKLKKKPVWQQVAMFGAGSTSNFMFGAIFFVLWLFVAGPIIDGTMTVGSIEFSNVMNESSLKDFNVSAGFITSLNGISDREQILNFLSNITPNQDLNLTIVNNAGNEITYPITTFENKNVPGRGMIGITDIKFEFGNKIGFDFLGNLPLHFERLLFYIWFLNIAIGLMNLLPLWITDGGQITRELFKKYFKENTALRLNNLLSTISLVLIFFTVWPNFLYYFLGLF